MRLLSGWRRQTLMRFIVVLALLLINVGLILTRSPHQAPARVLQPPPLPRH